MNIDDPKLTAFALDELDEPERSIIAREIADSPEAQRFVDETREIARGLKNEFATELETSPNKKAAAPASLIDIRDDPWFWSIERPLAIAAVITVCAILGAIIIGKYKSRNDSTVTAGGNFTDIQAEEAAPSEAVSEFSGPESVPNPLRPDVVQRIERVVIGELDPHLENGEIRVIETVNDAYRLERLKKRLTTPILSKKSHREFVRRTYELMFLDRNGDVVASAAFYQAPDFGFVLHPSKHAYQRDGHYFSDRGDTVL